MLLANWGLYEKENELQSSTIGTLEVIESNFTNSTRRGDKRDAQSEYEKQTAISWPIRLEKQFRLED